MLTMEKEEEEKAEERWTEQVSQVREEVSKQSGLVRQQINDQALTHVTARRRRTAIRPYTRTTRCSNIYGTGQQRDQKCRLTVG